MPKSANLLCKSCRKPGPPQPYRNCEAEYRGRCNSSGADRGKSAKLELSGTRKKCVLMGGIRRRHVTQTDAGSRQPQPQRDHVVLCGPFDDRGHCRTARSSRHQLSSAGAQNKGGRDGRPRRSRCRNRNQQPCRRAAAISPPRDCSTPACGVTVHFLRLHHGRLSNATQSRRGKDSAGVPPALLDEMDKSRG